MVIRSLFEINKEYENIHFSQLTEHQKTTKYSQLMTEMEQMYKIPILKDKSWEKENRPIIAMYRKISLSRKI